MSLDHHRPEQAPALPRARHQYRTAARSNPPPTQAQREALIEARDHGPLGWQHGGLWSADPTRDGRHVMITIITCRKYGWLAPVEGHNPFAVNQAAHVITAAGRAAIGELAS